MVMFPWDTPFLILLAMLVLGLFVYKMSGVIIGIIEVFIIGFVGGWLFAVIYNKLK